MGEKIGVKNEKVRWREYLDFLSLHTIFYNLENQFPLGIIRQQQSIVFESYRGKAAHFEIDDSRKPMVFHKNVLIPNIQVNQVLRLASYFFQEKIDGIDRMA
jgi:hypothetical protein